MNSFNHYAYGSIGEWMYRVVAGLEIDPREPGYKHVLIQPQPGGGLTWVESRLDTMYGRVATARKLAGGQFQLSVTVPAHTRATVRLPGATLGAVTEGGRSVTAGPGMAPARQAGKAVVVEVGSGTYAFAYPAANLELPGPSLPAARP